MEEINAEVAEAFEAILQDEAEGIEASFGAGQDEQVMDETELVAILNDEETDAVGYYNSDIATEQEVALDYYYGEPFGDEVEGRSSVVSRDVAEVIDWTIPDLARVFTSGNNIVDFEPNRPGDEEFIEEAAAALNYSFFAENNGFILFHDFVKDGLLQKIGVLRVDWQPPRRKAPEILTGLPSVALQGLMETPNAEILEVSQEQVEPSEAYPDGMMFDVKVVSMEPHGRLVFDNIPPEEFLVARRSRNANDLSYVAQRTRKTKSWLVQEFPDRRDEIEGLAKSEDEELDTRTTTRFRDEDFEADYSSQPADESMQEVLFLDEYVRVDFDGDGIAELRHVQRVDNTIFLNEEVGDHPFGVWCPVRMPHKLIGLSQADQVMDIQRINSVLWRSALDSTYLNVNPRLGINQGKVNLDDLLTVRAGSVVRVDGPPGESIQPIQTPDLSASAMQMMEFTDQRREARTGITRHAQGLDPDAINHTFGGIRALQEASNGRKELIARLLAHGLEMLFGKALKLLIRHQEGPREVFKDGAWKAVDPAKWNEDLRPIVHVGLGTGSRETQLAFLNMLAQKQELIFTQAGAANPLVTPQEYYNLMEEMTEVMGYRSADKFFKNPGQQQPQQEQAPNPKMLEVQVKSEEAKAKMELEKYKVESKQKLDEWKAQQELMLSKWKAEQELALAERKMNLEAELAGQEMGADLVMGKHKIDTDTEIKSSVRMGGKVG